MTELKSALRAVEKARAAKNDARRAVMARAERLRQDEIGGQPLIGPDLKMAALQRDEAAAVRALRAAESELAIRAPGHIAALASDRAKIVKAALAAIAALEKAELADRALMAEHAWARPPAVIGELPYSVHALRQRLEHVLTELEPVKSGRAA